MRFRSVVLAAVLGLVAAILVGTVAAVAVVIDRTARTTLLTELERGRQVFIDFVSYRESLYGAQARLMAEEPRLKAVVDTQDVNHETVLGVAVDLRKAIQADLFLVTDGTGRLVADVADPGAIGFDLSDKPLVKSALERGEGSDVWTHGDHAYKVIGRRLSFGQSTVGALVIGYEVSDRVAETVFRQTGDSVVIALAETPIAVAGIPPGLDRASLGSTLIGLDAGGAPQEIALGGSRYLATTSTFPGRSAGAPGPSAPRPLRYTLLRSLDAAREPVTRILSLVYVIGGLALVAALLFATQLSRRLSQPIDALVRFADAVAAGDLDHSVAPSGPVELRTLGGAMNHMVSELAQSRGRLADQERMRRELEIATRIQTAMLPAEMRVEGLELSAKMIPAEDVGGDYYDVLPFPGGAWIAIGDVAGHGLTAGLVMMMIQSIVSALVAERPNAAPAEILILLNRTLYENIRTRLRQDEHVTLTLFHYDRGGKIVYAGAHEELLVCRAGGGPTERLATPGTWLGAVPDISHATPESELTLYDGDLLALYTDGVIQAMNAAGDQFGVDRFCAELERGRELPLDRIRDNVLAAVTAFQSEQYDDVTLLLLRYRAS